MPTPVQPKPQSRLLANNQVPKNRITTTSERPKPPPPRPPTFTPLNRSKEFSLLDPNLGDGTYASVWRLRSPGGTQSALKVPKPNHSQALSEERRILELCRGIPNMLSMLDYFEVDRGRFGITPAIQMPLLPGPDAHTTYISPMGPRASLSVTQAIDVAEKILQALSVLHARGLTHRDIKAENMMVRLEGQNLQTILFDLGAAQETDQIIPGDLTAMTECCSPPETLRGEAYNDKVDVWGLGITIIELYTGNPLFKANHTQLTQDCVDMLHQISLCMDTQISDTVWLQHEYPRQTNLIQSMRKFLQERTPMQGTSLPPPNSKAIDSMIKIKRLMKGYPRGMLPWKALIHEAAAKKGESLFASRILTSLLGPMLQVRPGERISAADALRNMPTFKARLEHHSI